MIEKDIKHWFVLRAIFHKEEKVRDKLRHAGIHCYVPMRFRTITEQGHRVRRLMPAITELVFVHDTEETIKEFKLHSKDTIYWLTKPSGNKREKIIVPDKAMNDFIRVTQQSELSVTYFHPEEINLNKGDRIIIHGGSFDGVEGILLKIKGKREKKLLVSIPNIVSAAVSIKPEMVEIIAHKRKKSSNPTSDVKELIRLATQMLTSPPSRSVQAAEWDLLYFEIQRLYDNLNNLQAYLPTLKGEMALSLLLAEKVLKQTISPQTQQRFLSALSNLGENTLMSVRMQLIGGILLPDSTLLSKARLTLADWNKAPTAPTDRQRAILEEAAMFSNKF